MQNTWGRAAVAGVAVVLAFTMWRSGTIDQLLNFRQEGKPMDDDKPKQQASLAKALNDLLFGAGGPAAEKHKNSPLADQTK